MKRLFKFLFNLVMALLAVCLTLVILFFMYPAWQKSAVESLLDQDSARQWQIDSVRIRPAEVEVEGVFVLDGAVGAEVKFARITGPFWKLPLSGIVEIDSGELMGLEVDLSGIRVGDPTAEDYQDLLHRISTDHKFWQERVGLVLSKFTASGMKVHLRNVLLTGKVLMPGDKVVPLRWFILEADSDAPRLIKVSPYPEQPRVL